MTECRQDGKKQQKTQTENKGEEISIKEFEQKESVSWESLPNHLPNAHLFDLVTHFKVLFYFGWYSAINFKLKYSQRFNSVVECLLSVCKVLALILDTKDIHI